MSPGAILLIRANALAHLRAEVLADFELATVREAHDRVVFRGGVLTEAERQVVQEAVDAMLSAPRQDLTCEGLAA